MILDKEQRKEIRKGKPRRIIKSFIDLPNKLNQITFDLFSITKAHESFKNIDIQSKLFKDEVSHPSLEELFIQIIKNNKSIIQPLNKFSKG